MKIQYIVRANFPDRKRPLYLNVNYAGQAWGARSSAQRYASEEEAEGVAESVRRGVARVTVVSDFR